MRFYKHKITGQIITEGTLDFLNGDTVSEYELSNEFQLEYLSKISGQLKWVVGFLAVQFFLSIIGVIYFLF